VQEPPISLSISRAASALGSGPLEESSLGKHVAPLFSRVLGRQEIYLANHSLGRPLDQTRDDVLEALDLWYSDMDRGWEAWLGEQSHMRARLALLLGLSRPDAVVPKTSAGQGLRAVHERAVVLALPQASRTQVEVGRSHGLGLDREARGQVAHAPGAVDRAGEVARIAVDQPGVGAGPEDGLAVAQPFVDLVLPHEEMLPVGCLSHRVLARIFDG
jgi:hypothetical protein